MEDSDSWKSNNRIPVNRNFALTGSSSIRDENISIEYSCNEIRNKRSEKQKKRNPSKIETLEIKYKSNILQSSENKNEKKRKKKIPLMKDRGTLHSQIKDKMNNRFLNEWNGKYYFTWTAAEEAAEWSKS